MTKIIPRGTVIPSKKT
jgi:heat shock protein 5